MKKAKMATTVAVSALIGLGSIGSAYADTEVNSSDTTATVTSEGGTSSINGYQCKSRYLCFKDFGYGWGKVADRNESWFEFIRYDDYMRKQNWANRADYFVNSGKSMDAKVCAKKNQQGVCKKIKMTHSSYKNTLTWYDDVESNHWTRP